MKKRGTTNAAAPIVLNATKSEFEGPEDPRDAALDEVEVFDVEVELPVREGDAEPLLEEPAAPPLLVAVAVAVPEVAVVVVELPCPAGKAVAKSCSEE